MVKDVAYIHDIIQKLDLPIEENNKIIQFTCKGVKLHERELMAQGITNGDKIEIEFVECIRAEEVNSE